MFATLPSPLVDQILALGMAYRNDERPGKIDLGIGVYKDSSGTTPVMRAVKLAERRVWEEEVSKSYLGMDGSAVYCAAMLDLVLGKSIARERVRSIQTTGGGAAVRLLAELLATGRSDRTIWVPNPTWINHVPIAEAVGLRVRPYTYLNHSTSTVDFSKMMEDLAEAVAGDVVLVHGCCHNTSGADLDRDQWTAFAEFVSLHGVLPFFDIAYQGFGDGLEEDVYSVRLVAQQVPEMVIATSCSNNFGVYRDRVGSAIVVGANSADADRARAVLLARGRVNYSFPPNHGAAVVATILSDPLLLEDWRSELETMRKRLLRTRVAMTDALGRSIGNDRFHFIADHKGMFSLLGLSTSQIERLRNEHAIFLPGDGRCNMAAIGETSVEPISRAIAAVL